MSCWAVIPIKPPPDRKTRLAQHLDEEARDRLVRRMAAHVAGAAQSAQGIDHVRFLTMVANDLVPAIGVLPDAGGGLNRAVADALALVAAAGGTRAVIVAGDLPLVTPNDIAMLAALGVNAVGLATDRHGIGTNALSLPLPRAAGFRCAFGPDSCASHRVEIGRLGLELVEIRSEGLAHDVDLPDDLADAAGLMQDHDAPTHNAR